MNNLSRRDFLVTVSAAGIASAQVAHAQVSQAGKRPNILFAIADDWSYPYASAYGTAGLQTPAFDRIAREGCLFNNCFTAAPQCSPNRAAILTGRQIWQLQEAGTHASIFPKKYPVYPDLLEESGYHVGYTGKGWGPGDWKAGGWARNPAGPEFNAAMLEKQPTKGIAKFDYCTNFTTFLKEKPADAPFSFWYGGKEPHRDYQEGSGAAAGKRLEDVKVPAFLPDVPEVRSDFLDHFLEVEYFDKQLQIMLTQLEALGELDNTIVVVTADNGMSWPYAKANCSEYGIHVPLAIRWPGVIAAGAVSDALISHVDLAPTFLAAAGQALPETIVGKNIGDWVAGGGTPRSHILSGRERHTHARFDNLGYPARALRDKNYLYIRNFAPDRNPAGDPEGFYDIDDGATKRFLLEHRDQYPELFQLACGKRPAEELYDITKDAACVHNLAADATVETVRSRMAAQLTEELTRQQDPRVVGPFNLFDSYPRISEMRPELGGFSAQNSYNPKYAPAQPEASRQEE